MQRLNFLRCLIPNFRLDIGDQLLDRFGISLFNRFGSPQTSLSIGRFFRQDMPCECPLGFDLSGPGFFEYALLLLGWSLFLAQSSPLKDKIFSRRVVNWQGFTLLDKTPVGSGSARLNLSLTPTLALPHQGGGKDRSKLVLDSGVEPGS
jgi:hypothetical protein